MKHDWEYKTIGQLCSIKTGKLDANASSIDGAYPFFTCSKEVLRIDNYSYDEECVLIAGNGDLNVKYYKGKFDAYQRTYIVSLKDKDAPISVPYLYQFFSKYVKHLRTVSIGGVIKYIKLNNLTDAIVPIPPLPVQQQIVAELDKVNEVIEKKKQQVKELDILAQSIFYDMFGDPVENEKGWKVSTLKEVSTLLNGRAYKQDELLEKGRYKVLRVGNFFTNGSYYYSDLELDEDKYCDCGDLLFAWSASFGAFIWSGEKVIFHYHIWKVLFDEGQLDKIYYLYLLNTMTKSFMKDVHGIGMFHLTKIGMEQYQLPIPPLSLQQTFAKKIEAIEKQKELINQSIKETQTLFDSRMDYYFGE